jgi:crotonobetainyl-CoA:carnitine CoA-transferase CaiB-like acyl-CoA transferase
MHGEKGPWSNRPGFDEIGAAVSGLFTIEGSPTQPKQPPIVPIADNVVGWLGTTGILAALRRRAIEGGSYRVVVSLTRTVLRLLSLGYLRQGLRESDRQFDRRAQLCRSGSVHRGNAAWYLSGNDRPSRNVAHPRRLPHGPGPARLKQTRMACGLSKSADFSGAPRATNAEYR